MSVSLDNDFHHRIDLFEPGDSTALVCVDVPEVQRLVVENLTEIDYRIHTGLFLEDIQLKLQSHTYDVVIVGEHFNASNIETTTVLEASRSLPSGQRRLQMFVLVGSGVHTDSEMEAWAANVDLVVSLSDVPNLKHVVRRAATRRTAFYTPLIEAYVAAGVV